MFQPEDAAVDGGIKTSRIAAGGQRPEAGGRDMARTAPSATAELGPVPLVNQVPAGRQPKLLINPLGAGVFALDVQP